MKKEVKPIENLFEGKNFFKLFIDSSPDLIFVKDNKFRYLTLNKANVKFFGKKEKDIIGKTDYDLMPPEAAKGCRDSDNKALKNKKIVIKTEKVGDKFYETYKFPIKLGKKYGIGGIIRNITELKKIESELKRSNDELKVKLGELEGFTKLTVGRELKMIELKKKLKNLEEKVKK